ncbi:MAG: hypothetical protein AB1847_03980 [bacterium]
MYPSMNIPAVTGKIYRIIENLTDIIEELNKNPSPANGPPLADGPLSAQTSDPAGAEGVALEGDSGGSGGGAARGEEPGGETAAVGAAEGSGKEAWGTAAGREGSGATAGETAAEAAGGKRGAGDPARNGPESPESKDSDLFRYLSSTEGLELIRLESTRQSLLRAQGFLEEKKQVLVGLARKRQVGTQLAHNSNNQ